MTAKHTIKYVRQRFEKEGYILLSTEYKRARGSKLEYICPSGHKYANTWDNWNQGKRCYYCGREKIRKFLTLEYDYVVEDKDGNELDLKNKKVKKRSVKVGRKPKTKKKKGGKL